MEFVTQCYTEKQIPGGLKFAREDKNKNPANCQLPTGFH